MSARGGGDGGTRGFGACPDCGTRHLGECPPRTDNWDLDSALANLATVSNESLDGAHALSPATETAVQELVYACLDADRLLRQGSSAAAQQTLAMGFRGLVEAVVRHELAPALRTSLEVAFKGGHLGKIP